jgi:hypothetical protein
LQSLAGWLTQTNLVLAFPPELEGVQPPSLYHFAVSYMYGYYFPPHILLNVRRSYDWYCELQWGEDHCENCGQEWCEDQEIMINMDEEYDDDWVAHEIAAGILSQVYHSHHERPTSGWDRVSREECYRSFPWTRPGSTIKLPYFGLGTAWIDVVNRNYGPSW